MVLAGDLALAMDRVERFGVSYPPGYRGVILRKYDLSNAYDALRQGGIFFGATLGLGDDAAERKRPGGVRRGSGKGNRSCRGSRVQASAIS